jgi:orotate phosphoribosyltransferase
VSSTGAAELEALERDLFTRALLRGTFTLRSGRTSDRYFDKYLATTDPALLRQISLRMAQIVGELSPSPEVIVAPELGAVPLATALGLQTGLPSVFVRGAGKDYGTSKRLEGRLDEGSRAVLVEDVVTSGGAALEAALVAREAGAQLDTCICLLDRGEGGADALAEHDVRLVSVVDAAALERAWSAGLGTQVGG